MQSFNEWSFQDKIIYFHKILDQANIDSYDILITQEYPSFYEVAAEVLPYADEKLKCSSLLLVRQALSYIDKLDEIMLLHQEFIGALEELSKDSNEYVSFLSKNILIYID